MKNVATETVYLIELPSGKELCVDDGWFAVRSPEQLRGVVVINSRQVQVEIVETL